jgi:hypothetical protein
MIHKSLYLYHYYEDERGPFRNLSSLNHDEASHVMDKIRMEGQIFASQRSSNYLNIRRQLEAKAREMFISKGGSPAHSYPHYMTIGKCNWIKEWYKCGKELRIHIDEFDPEHISFTYGDLFPTMRYQDGKPYRGVVYTKQEIMKVIEQFGFPQEWNKDGKLGPERYIEVQVWDDRKLASFFRSES